MPYFLGGKRVGSNGSTLVGHSNLHSFNPWWQVTLIIIWIFFLDVSLWFWQLWMLAIHFKTETLLLHWHPRIWPSLIWIESLNNQTYNNKNPLLLDYVWISYRFNVTYYPSECFQQLLYQFWIQLMKWVVSPHLFSHTVMSQSLPSRCQESQVSLVFPIHLLPYRMSSHSLYQTLMVIYSNQVSTLAAR